MNINSQKGMIRETKKVMRRENEQWEDQLCHRNAPTCIKGLLDSAIWKYVVIRKKDMFFFYFLCTGWWLSFLCESYNDVNWSYQMRILDKRNLNIFCEKPLRTTLSVRPFRVIFRGGGAQARKFQIIWKIENNMQHFHSILRRFFRLLISNLFAPT